jgi:hypothetical protein
MGVHVAGGFVDEAVFLDLLDHGVEGGDPFCRFGNERNTRDRLTFNSS